MSVSSFNRGGRTAAVVTSKPSHQHSDFPILETLFQNFEFDFEEVSSSIDPILTVQNRCQGTSLYIQGIISHKGAFISTNLAGGDIYVTPRGLQWSIGCSQDCVVKIDSQSMTGRHSILQYDGQGFYLVNSGTGQIIVDDTVLLYGQRAALSDSSTIEIGGLKVEFFLDCFKAVSKLDLAS